MKTWGQRLNDHVEFWSKKIRPDWVPKFVYHFSDINNVASILETGSVYSRNLADEREAMVVDQACASVIEHTAQDHLGYARLYFRPKTPTQFLNEGIRPQQIVDQASTKAHCPVPVFLCFDFVETLGMDGVRFSDGNMARGRAQHSDSEEFFAQLPFNLIYHNSWFQSHEKDEIIYRRHAEVLIPGELPLNHKLRLVVCRSDAERRTLLHLLMPATRRQWEPRIRNGYADLFESKWWYVTNVFAQKRVVTIELHQGTHPIELTYERTRRGAPPGRHKKLLQVERGQYNLRAQEQTVKINASSAVDSEITIRLGGHLAFKGRVTDADQVI